MNNLYTLQNVSITRFKEFTTIQKRTLRALKSIYLKFSLYTFIYLFLLINFQNAHIQFFISFFIL